MYYIILKSLRKKYYLSLFKIILLFAGLHTTNYTDTVTRPDFIMIRFNFQVLIFSNNNNVLLNPLRLNYFVESKTFHNCKKIVQINQY